MVPQGNDSLVTRDLALSQSARLAAVQAPVIPIVGRWMIRDPQWGPGYSRNYGARPRIAVTVMR